MSLVECPACGEAGLAFDYEVEHELPPMWGADKCIRHPPRTFRTLTRRHPACGFYESRSIAPDSEVARRVENPDGRLDNDRICQEVPDDVAAAVTAAPRYETMLETTDDAGELLCPDCGMAGVTPTQMSLETARVERNHTQMAGRVPTGFEVAFRCRRCEGHGTCRLSKDDAERLLDAARESHAASEEETDDPVGDFENELNEYGPPEKFTPHGDGAEGEYALTTDTTDESMSNTNTDDKAPLADGATVLIHADDPIVVTRAGTTYHAWDVADGDPVGDPWVLSEGAVRGLLGRHDWTRVEGSIEDNSAEAGE